MNILKAIGAFFYELFVTFFRPLTDSIKRAAAARGNPTRRLTAAVVAIIVIVGSGASLLMTQCPATPKVEMAPFIALGQVVAQETAKLLGNQGHIVLLVPDTGGVRKSPTTVQLQSFQRELKQTGGIVVVTTETINSPEVMIMGLTISADNYRKLVEKYPHVDAFVSFVGAPPPDHASLEGLPATVPELVAVCPAPLGLKSLFKTGLLQVAVVPRFESLPDAPAKPATPHQWFARYFQVVTAQDTGSMPD